VEPAPAVLTKQNTANLAPNNGRGRESPHEGAVAQSKELSRHNHITPQIRKL